MSVSSSFTLVICFGLSGWISNKSVRSLAFGIFEKWKVKRPSGRVCVDALRGKWDWEPPTCCDCPAAAPTQTPSTAPTHTSSWCIKKKWEKPGWHLMAPFFCGFCIFTCLRWKPDGSEKWILAVKIYHSHTTKLERTSTIKICEEKNLMKFLVSTGAKPTCKCYRKVQMLCFHQPSTRSLDCQHFTERPGSTVSL